MSARLHWRLRRGTTTGPQPPSAARAHPRASKKDLELGTAVRVGPLGLKGGIERREGVRAVDVEGVVDLPVDLADTPRWMVEAREHVGEDDADAERDDEGLDGLEDGGDDVGRGLEDVGPDVVHEVDEGVLAAEAGDAEREVLDRRRGGLAVDEVTVHEGVLEERRHGVDVVLAHLADVLEEEGERLEDAVLDVELGNAVLVHERGEHGERRARLGDDADRDSRADAVLALLDLEVVEQRVEHVLRAYRLGDVAERVDRRAADRLLVRLEHLEELEADAHPLARGDELGPAVGDAPDEVDAVVNGHRVGVEGVAAGDGEVVDAPRPDLAPGNDLELERREGRIERGGNRARVEPRAGADLLHHIALERARLDR
mmetsp:Transcript_11071/g.44852  ORF Transcript_11071/g.44852 Transcript_11071/m.44852 type:complete len:373 (+) Transcript_11071:170-1288(+)